MSLHYLVKHETAIVTSFTSLQLLSDDDLVITDVGEVLITSDSELFITSISVG